MSSATDKPTSKVEWITAEDGHEIFTKTWYPVGKPVASIVFVHGLGEHIVRYDGVFEDFNKAGFQVSAFDQRGFGQTGKKSKTLGCTGGFKKAIPDITAALERGQIEGLPLFLMGHSYGGDLVLNYDCVGPLRTRLAGLIASAPLIIPAEPTRPNWISIIAARYASKVFPSLQISTGLSSKWISRDKKEVEKYDTDPLVHGYVTMVGLNDMLTYGKLLLTERYKEITADVPLLICHGDKDGLTDAAASKQFFDKVQVKDKEYKLYEGHFHELHNEPEEERRKVIDYYIEWIKKHLPDNNTTAV
ncbi:Alpha/Beta hydrolase protein [Lobosporangium transversale]|uniref:Alpha/Beta hydrolase protein n=1 Tax=Lobosporangium transversale TaxID=64571 RepID=A0A1Y2GS57_9FUNG|nr:Alpha/Beta hydrolase protein [Lobosporangium transversale]ORZ19303.1 Alpha/Beta hydrolase protein [Lobosporangium transversale]|eukprot:XP_021882471.1 Alpha/Beta hydrolase protein [Lobosporangium transversale]